MEPWKPNQLLPRTFLISLSAPGTNSALGLLWNIEWVVGDLSLMEGLGYDVRNNDIPGRDNAFFQRAGVKYQFGKQKKTFGGILIRATNLYSARYVEWMIGRIVTWQ